MFCYFLVDFLNYQCLKTGNVTKGTHLLEVPTRDFDVIPLEIGNKSAININNYSTIKEISDKNFSSFL